MVTTSLPGDKDNHAPTVIKAPDVDERRAIPVLDLGLVIYYDVYV